MSYVIVVDKNNEGFIELLAEPDGSLLLSTLSTQFPGACGLRYHNFDTGRSRVLGIDDAGKILPPLDGWNAKTFIAVFHKNNRKRRKVIQFCLEAVFTDFSELFFAIIAIKLAMYSPESYHFWKWYAFAIAFIMARKGYRFFFNWKWIFFFNCCFGFFVTNFLFYFELFGAAFERCVLFFVLLYL